MYGGGSYRLAATRSGAIRIAFRIAPLRVAAKRYGLLLLFNAEQVLLPPNVDLPVREGGGAEHLLAERVLLRHVELVRAGVDHERDARVVGEVEFAAGDDTGAGLVA